MSKAEPRPIYTDPDKRRRLDDLASLVKEFFEIELPKSSQKANWARRPLSPAMIQNLYDLLGQLKDRGVIRIGYRSITMLDPVLLHKIAYEHE